MMDERDELEEASNQLDMHGDEGTCNCGRCEAARELLAVAYVERDRRNRDAWTAWRNGKPLLGGLPRWEAEAMLRRHECDSISPATIPHEMDDDPTHDLTEHPDGRWTCACGVRGQSYDELARAHA